jgi:hypothetical protein
MKKLFYTGLIGLTLFEVANVYFIMPMPGSQRMDSLDLAYFLHQWRWVFRVVFGVVLALGLPSAFRASVWLPAAALAGAGFIIYQVNAEMAADKMFYQPRTLRMADAQNNTVGLDKLVLGVDLNGQAKAYPIQFIGYHHQVRDTVGGHPVLVSYCTVCRTGRVFSPIIDGRTETFRLVGMDHFNAMLEDQGTGSWWRQATGEAVAGPLKGKTLPEWPAQQTTLGAWLALYPHSLVMQPDGAFAEEYAGMATYDIGIGRGALTATDTLSWKDKSWVVGLEHHGVAKAYDWNQFKRERMIHDQLGEKPVLLVLAADGNSFFAFERPQQETAFTLRSDTLFSTNRAWNLAGVALSADTQPLQRVHVYQEFWHSWKTFHPNTLRYDN